MELNPISDGRHFHPFPTGKLLVPLFISVRILRESVLLWPDCLQNVRECTAGGDQAIIVKPVITMYLHRGGW